MDELNNSKRCTCGDEFRPGAYDPTCPIDGLDIEQEWEEEINNLPADWNTENIIGKELS
jgi:hypothetical protein